MRGSNNNWCVNRNPKAEKPVGETMPNSHRAMHFSTIYLNFAQLLLLHGKPRNESVAWRCTRSCTRSCIRCMPARTSLWRQRLRRHKHCQIAIAPEWVGRRGELRRPVGGVIGPLLLLLLGALFSCTSLPRRH